MAAKVTNKPEARQKVRFTEIITPSGMVETWADLPFTDEEKAYNTANSIKTRNIDYLYFPGLTVGGNGKDQLDTVRWTFAEYADHEKSLANPKMPADVYLSGKASKVSAWMGDTNESIRECFLAITTGIKYYEEEVKEDGPAILRNVKAMVTDNAGKIAAIMDTDQLDTVVDFLTKNWPAIVAAKQNLEDTNKRDDLGQIRLKAPSTKKPKA